MEHVANITVTVNGKNSNALADLARLIEYIGAEDFEWALEEEGQCDATLEDGTEITVVKS